METFDFVIIGAGPAGEAAAYKARELGATVAIIDREWFGGSCPHIGCLPSKSLLDGAARHHAERRHVRLGRGVERARLHGQPTRRTPPNPTIRATSTRCVEAGAVAYRGSGVDRRLAAGSTSGTTTAAHELAATNVVVAVGSVTKRPPIEGIDEIPTWTNREATLDAGAAEEPARPRRRPDRLRAGPGLRPVRGADHDRPVRAEAVPDRPPAKLRGDPGGPRAGRRGRADRGPRGAGTCRRRSRWRTRHRARRRIHRPGPRDPARGRSHLPARRSRSRALRDRHDRSDAVPA